MADAWGNPAADAPENSSAETNGNDANGHNTDGADGHSVTAAEVTPAAPVPDVEELKAKAKEAGWVDTIPVNYELYNHQGGDFAGYMAEGAVYEWSDEYGDVAPEVPALEQQLFGGEFRLRRGEHTSGFEIEVTVEGPTKLHPARRFEDAGLHPVVLSNVVEKCDYGKPMPIQAWTIPAILQGNDIIAVAQTGSGKTAAYLIPVISRLMGKARKLCAPKPNVLAPSFNVRIDKVRAEPLVVIVVPTRELAVQVFDEARRLCYRSMLRPVAAYGGLPMGVCLDELGKGCDILIASPGRLCDLMDRPAVLTMSRIKYTILDEADEMLHDDWQEQLTKIMAGGDTNEDADHTYLMFSATFPAPLRKLAREYMADDHYVLRVGRAGSTHKNIKQDIVFVDRDMKRQALYDLLFASEPARTLIFCNSKATVDQLDDYLYNRQLPTTSIHADRSQREREDSIRAFRCGMAPIMIATGISARGWDVAGIMHVINYDLPSNMHGGIDEYIHRIGRTARIGHKGIATSFYNDRDEDLGQALVNILVESGSEIPEFLEHLKPEEGAKPDFQDDSDEEEEAGTGDDGGVPATFGDNAGGDTSGFAAESAWGAATEDNNGGDAIVANAGAAPAGW